MYYLYYRPKPKTRVMGTLAAIGWTLGITVGVWALLTGWLSL